MTPGVVQPTPLSLLVPSAISQDDLHLTFRKFIPFYLFIHSLNFSFYVHLLSAYLVPGSDIDAIEERGKQQNEVPLLVQFTE